MKINPDDWFCHYHIGHKPFIVRSHNQHIEVEVISINFLYAQIGLKLIFTTEYHWWIAIAYDPEFTL